MFFQVKDMVTALNLVCGFLAILMVFEGQFALAQLLIFAGVIFDRLDGFVARTFFEPTPFGVEFDSLCDLVSFGVAPAFLVYATHARDVYGLLAGLALVLAGATRLARFNLIGAKNTKSFVGLPITISGLYVVLFLKAGLLLEWAPLLLLLLALLNVSTFEYCSYKGKSGGVVTGVLTGLILAAFFWPVLWKVLVLGIALYFFSPLLKLLKG